MERSLLDCCKARTGDLSQCTIDNCTHAVWRRRVHSASVSVVRLLMQPASPASMRSIFCCLRLAYVDRVQVNVIVEVLFRPHTLAQIVCDLLLAREKVDSDERKALAKGLKYGKMSKCDRSNFATSLHMLHGDRMLVKCWIALIHSNQWTIGHVIDE